ncbi:MAG TPA: hypothetical protein VH113_01750 [Gemmatimonadales bacterium]|nr:hypothetical protein [Gemmatimonadales bacterium]
MIRSGRWGGLATCAAIGFLLIDASLLGYGAITFHRVSLGVGGALCFLLAVLVFYAWLKYRRILAELTAARRDMRHEVEELRELIRRHPS